MFGKAPGCPESSARTASKDVNAVRLLSVEGGSSKGAPTPALIAEDPAILHVELNVVIGIEGDKHNDRADEFSKAVDRETMPLARRPKG